MEKKTTSRPAKPEATSSGTVEGQVVCSLVNRNGVWEIIDHLKKEGTASNPGTTSNQDNDVSSPEGADLLASKLASLALDTSKTDSPPEKRANLVPMSPPYPPHQGAPSQSNQIPPFSWDNPMFGTEPDREAKDPEEFYRGYDMSQGLSTVPFDPYLYWSSFQR